MPVTPELANDTSALHLYSDALGRFGRLNLPPCGLRLRKSQTTKMMDVYDELRRTWVALTPEEWVRQHFVHYMVTTLGFSALRIANEVPLKLNNTSRRADTVVYDDFLHPIMVVEYKAPEIAMTKKVLEQALLYNFEFNAPAIMITNGLDVVSVLGDKAWRGVITAEKIDSYLIDS